MPKARVYDSTTSQWIYLDAKNADTLGGIAASGFALASHNHDSSYYTKTQSDTNYAPASHNHDSRYYTEAELNTSGGGGQVHWNNLTNKPTTFPPDAHNHDTAYYTKTQSDLNYPAKSNNLSDLPDKAAARTNLGLGTMATQSTSGFAIATHNHDTAYVLLTDVVTTPTANKILKLDSSSKAPASIINQDANNRLVTDVQITSWNNKSTFDGNYNSLSNKPTIPTNLDVRIDAASAFNVEVRASDPGSPTLGQLWLRSDL